MRIYRYRRYFQIFFFMLFSTLMTVTVWPLGHTYLGAFILANPLIALNTLAWGSWKNEILLAGLVLITPFLLGRVFCGYFCPLGFLIELFNPEIKHGKKTASKRAGTAKKLRPLPSLILTACLALTIFGVPLFLILDPLSLLTRTFTVIVYPLLQASLDFSGNLLYLFPPLRGPVDRFTTLLSGKLLFENQLVYQFQYLTLIIFTALFLLSGYLRRMWCSDLCPLGSLLGFFSRHSTFGRVVDEKTCIKCRKCESVCPMGAVRKNGLATDKTRCQLGFECADVCPTGAVSFGRRPDKEIAYPSRRAFLLCAGLSLTSGYFLAGTVSRREKEARLIRPPGSLYETDFLSACCRCGQCLKVCPTNVLQPSTVKAGLEGIFTPEMNYNLSYCDWSCNECGKVCPTGAIKQLALKIKRKTVIGRAYIDRNRCIPWSGFKNCLVCQELCPTPEKAIILQTEKVRSPDNKIITLKRPVVLEELCIGCGICEFNCPVAYEAAINIRASVPISPIHQR